MEAQETIKIICETLLSAFGNAAQKELPVTAIVNGGTCAGSVTYNTKPNCTRDETEVVKIVRGAYAANGLKIDLESDEGVKAFFRVFFEACRNVCSNNERVSLSKLLVFEPQVYSDDSKRAWMKPLMVNADFNALPNKVKLETSRALLARKRKAARECVCAAAVETDRAGRVTKVTCPNCGEKITIENTVK